MRSVRLYQAVSSLAMLFSLATTFAFVGQLSRSSAVLDWIAPQRIEKSRARDVVYVDKGPFTDVASRVLLGDVTSADFGRGSVSILGSSNLASGFDVSMLDFDARRLVFNWGIPGAVYSDQWNFLRYLIDWEGLLSAGSERTLVIVCLDYANASASRYFSAVFRYGLYSYDRESGLRPSTLPAIFRPYVRETARCGNLLQVVERKLRARRAVADGKRKAVPVARYVRTAHAIMTVGDVDWNSVMDEELDALSEMFEYLTSRGVPVRAVLMPEGSWQRDTPYAAAFRTRVVPVCERSAVPVLDLSRLLTDDEFADHTHTNYAGTTKLQEELEALMNAHLAGLLLR